MAESGSEATGVGAALLVDTLLSLGIDDPLALSDDERTRAITEAAADGRLDTERLTILREQGVLPT